VAVSGLPSQDASAADDAAVFSRLLLIAYDHINCKNYAAIIEAKQTDNSV